MGKYTLIVTEKPDAANRVAMALDADGKAKKIVDSGVPYYQASRNGNLIVVPALGHLYTVASKKKAKRDYPVFDYQWVPRYLAERGASKSHVWLNVISKLSENAEEFVDACDFDIEGSIIGYSILKFACGGKEKIAKRMKYSTLTKEELQESYTHLLPHLDFALIEAGLTRHEIDWLYGINLSRALTTAVKKNSGQYVTLSTGRVQGPTLKFLEDREKAIKCFTPTPYWSITAKIVINDSTYDAEYEKILETRQKANAVLDTCKTKEGQIETVYAENFEQKPPVPFDLGSLQSEAYRNFHFSPMRTSNIAQRLYLDALISYPRTSSQKLPAAIGYKAVLAKLAKMPAYGKQAAELLCKSVLKPNEGKKADPAHPAIYPTGNTPENSISISERKIFDLVVRRFMAVFDEPAIRKSIKVTVSVNGNHFHLNGIRTLSEGWLRFYRPYVQLKDVTLPTLTEGQKITVKKVVAKNNFTKPPLRYSPQSLLLKMEKEEIGTKATRAAIIQTLYDRKYLSGNESLVCSDLGFEVIETLAKYCSDMVSPELTRKLEEKMNEIQLGKETKEAVLQNAVEVLKPILWELKENEAVIGQHLSQALKKAWLDERTVGACPRCASGKLVILSSKKTGKRFVGCTNYFEGKCNATFPLPQNGSVKPLNITCKTCGFPILAVFLKRKRSWKLCLNPNCPTKNVSEQRRSKANGSR